MTFEYDDLADVMHVIFAEKFGPTSYTESESGAILRVEIATGRVVGVRILGFQRSLAQGQVSIPELENEVFAREWIAAHTA